MDVSVCVATYRRPAGLARLCKSLGRMKLPSGARVEILVVDNDPEAPETAPLPDAGGLPVRRLREPRRNIALARNRAIGAASGAWLAFVDDDEEVCEEWLAAYLAQAEQSPCDGYFGPVLARAERPEAGGARWLARFARGRFESGARVSLSAARTGNAFLRRRLFDGVAFDPEFGRSGGSDSELFARLLARGAELRWCDAAQVFEWLPPERLRARWLLWRAFRAGHVHGRLARRGAAARRALGAARAAAGLLAASALLPFGPCGGRAGALRAAMRVASAAGRIHGLLGGRYVEYASAEGARSEAQPSEGRSG